ncbi:MAG: hypothetical protein ABIR98_06015 [Usitatibacter sp.]
MTPERRRTLQIAFLVVVSVTFAVLAHAAIVQGVSPTVGALLSLMPASLFAGWAVSRTRHRVAASLVLALVAVALALGWPQLERHFPDVFFLEHVIINLVLAAVFGRTLFGARVPLVTRFARMIHGELPAEVERYARKVTIAWTALFLGIAAASCVLYLGGWLPAWSFLANFLNPLLLGAMFLLEYVVRHRVLPNWERVGVLGGVRAFSRHFQAARFEAPR